MAVAVMASTRVWGRGREGGREGEGRWEGGREGEGRWDGGREGEKRSDDETLRTS